MKFHKFEPLEDDNIPDWAQRLLEEENFLYEQQQANSELTSASGTSWFNQQLSFFSKADTFFDNMQTRIIGSITDFDE